MTEFESDQIEGIARNPLVGIDGEGAEHRFDSYHDIVHVLDGKTVEHVEDLDAGELPDWVDYVPDWVDYVDDKRGWEDCRYGGGNPFAAMVEQLADAMEAGA